jgi:hypothetical protein
MQGVFYGQNMRVVSGIMRQRFRRFVDGHVITLDIALGKGGGGQDVGYVWLG